MRIKIDADIEITEGTDNGMLTGALGALMLFVDVMLKPRDAKAPTATPNESSAPTSTTAPGATR